MELRPRYINTASSVQLTSYDMAYEEDRTEKKSSPVWRRIKRELQCTTRTFVDILTGRASKLTYLMIPVLFAMFWVLICIMTGGRSITLHDTIIQSRKVSVLKAQIIVEFFAKKKI